MPRHPPCALKNLNTTTTRCSRSQSSSQNTNGHQPTTTTNPPPPQRTNPCEDDQVRYGGRPGPPAQTPPTTQADQAPKRPEATNTPDTEVSVVPVSSGPNSVLDHPDPPGDGFPEPAETGSTHTPGTSPEMIE